MVKERFLEQMAPQMNFEESNRSYVDRRKEEVGKSLELSSMTSLETSKSSACVKVMGCKRSGGKGIMCSLRDL